MNAVSSEAMMLKFESLSERAKREVTDFMEFLVGKRKPRKIKIDKSKLLEISCWNDEDIKAIEDAGKEINKWQPIEF
jgi:hypothetical protein